MLTVIDFLSRISRVTEENNEHDHLEQGESAQVSI